MNNKEKLHFVETEVQITESWYMSQGYLYIDKKPNTIYW
jgi:hypothetical protein